jgi:hypothetical protein
VNLALGDPGGDNKQLFIFRAPTAANGGGVTIIAADIVSDVSGKQGVGGTTFSVALHRYGSVATGGTPAVNGTVAAAIGGTAWTWAAGVLNYFTIDNAAAYLKPGESLIAQYSEQNAGNPVNGVVMVRYVVGKRYVDSSRG